MKSLLLCVFLAVFALALAAPAVERDNKLLDMLEDIFIGRPRDRDPYPYYPDYRRRGDVVEREVIYE
uniref:Antimicrobial peptide n=1 Tax=Euperipatoides rowelli TaxID=49087 RepID=D9IX83_EUPRO|nr:antimicrobial peptide [Euperipatoides rowelli]